MPRPATGQILRRKHKGGVTFALRFQAYGRTQYVTLGKAEEGWSRPKAAAELRHILADVERGIWTPADRRPAVHREVPTLHRFATDWLRDKAPELRPKTVENYTWALSYHLLPNLGHLRLNEIGIEDIDRYKTAKLREGKIAPNQINTTLSRLSQILEDAVEYGHIDRNPAAGKRRRVKASKPRRSWVEPEQLPSLIEAANDRMRPLIATLAGAGLRVGEACSLDWRAVNLATGTLTVDEAKTEAGAGRVVDLSVGLRDELATLKASRRRVAPDDPVFTARGTSSRQTPSNVGRRLKTAIRRANERLDKLGIEPISERVTPHSLRRSYISLRAVLRDSPVTIAEAVGHTDPTFTLRVYAKATRRRERLTGTYAEQFDKACEWSAIYARKSTSDPVRAADERYSDPTEAAETALGSLN